MYYHHEPICHKNDERNKFIYVHVFILTCPAGCLSSSHFGTFLYHIFSIKFHIIFLDKEWFNPWIHQVHFLNHDLLNYSLKKKKIDIKIALFLNMQSIKKCKKMFPLEK